MHRHHFLRPAFLTIFLLFFGMYITHPVLSISPANAQSDFWYPPACEITIPETETLGVTQKTSEITLTDTSAVVTTAYEILNSGAKETLSCILPFFSNNYCPGEFGVTARLGDAEIIPKIKFSVLNSIFWNAETYSDIYKYMDTSEFSPESVTGSYVTFTVEQEETISFNLPEETRMIYEFSSYSYYSADRKFEINIKPDSPFLIYFIGECPEITTIHAVPEILPMTFKEYQDRLKPYFDILQEETGVDYTPAFNSAASSFFASGNMRIEENALLTKCFGSEYYFLDYQLTLPAGKSIFSVSQPIKFGSNAGFVPTVRMITILSPYCTAPCRYQVNTDCHIVQGTLTFTPMEGGYYGAGEDVEVLKIAYCKDANPTQRPGPQNPLSNSRKPLLIVCGILIGLSVITLIGLGIHTLAHRKK